MGGRKPSLDGVQDAVHALAARLLGLPPDRLCVFFSFGYPEDESKLTAPNRAGGRLALDELVHAERC